MNKPVAPSPHTSFTAPDALRGSLSAATAAALLAAVGDVTFILSASGEILDVAVAQGDLATHGFAGWTGRAWADTMTVESRPKVVEMLAEAGRDAPPRWRQVNHPEPGGDVPVRYLVMTLGPDRLIAVGRDMRGIAAMQQRLLQTQQSLERDYLKLRQTETRYRLLFDLTAEPMLIVDPGTRRVREANPAAHALLGVGDGALIGETLGNLIAAGQHDDLVAHFGAAEAADDVDPVVLPLAGGGEIRLSARLFRQERAPLLIIRLSPVHADALADHHDTAVGEVVERMPDAFVLADRELKVLAANAAFVELTELASADRLVGTPLGQWLGRPGIDLERIVAQLREHGAVRNAATVVHGAAGAEEEVEISGVAAPTGEGECYGFTIRSVSRRLRDAPATPPGVPRSVEQLTELVGRMSLKEIVRESTDLIERLCIEAALAYTSDNRASAAEILGVSRQSLYSKLHRHGLGNLVSGE